MPKLYRFLLINVATLGLVLGLGVGVAEAHVLKEDNGISGVLHIPPEDNPEAAQPTELDESFGDAKDAFSLQDCNCQIVVKSGDKVIQTVTPKPALTGATLDSVSTVTFPHIGVYDVIVEGSAKDGKFNTFKLDYLVRVATSANAPPPSSGEGSEVLLIGIGSIVMVGMVSYSYIKAGGRYAPPVKTKVRSKK